MFSWLDTDEKKKIQNVKTSGMRFKSATRYIYIYANKKKRGNVLNNTLHQYLILIILITAMNYSFLYKNPNNLRSFPILIC